MLKVSDFVIVIDYADTAQQFLADVRKSEADIGIGLEGGVKLELVTPVSGWR